jgi:polyhydroxyalkanoate synthesis regulator phasin
VPNAREQYLQALSSLTEMTRSRAERLGSLLVKQGELQSAQVGRFAEQLVRRTQKNRETMSRLVQREVKRQLSTLGIATRDEVARLQQRVRALEQAMERPAVAASRSRAGTTEPAGRATASRGTTTARRGTTASRAAAAPSGSSARGATTRRTGRARGGSDASTPERRKGGQNE